MRIISPRAGKPHWLVLFLSGVAILWMVFFIWVVWKWLAGGREQAPDLFTNTAQSRPAAKVIKVPPEAEQAAGAFIQQLTRGGPTKTTAGFVLSKEHTAFFKEAVDMNLAFELQIRYHDRAARGHTFVVTLIDGARKLNFPFFVDVVYEGGSWKVSKLY